MLAFGSSHWSEIEHVTIFDDFRILSPSQLIIFSPSSSTTFKTNFYNPLSVSNSIKNFPPFEEQFWYTIALLKITSLTKWERITSMVKSIVYLTQVLTIKRTFFLVHFWRGGFIYNTDFLYTTWIVSDTFLSSIFCFLLFEALLFQFAPSLIHKSFLSW